MASVKSPRPLRASRSRRLFPDAIGCSLPEFLSEPLNVARANGIELVAVVVIVELSQ